MNRKRKYQYSAIALFVTFSITYAVFWNIARDEVYYLCGNFTTGFTQASVIRQLETANLSNYIKSDETFGSRLVFSSKLNFSFYQCVIDINKNKEVIKATFS